MSPAAGCDQPDNDNVRWTQRQLTLLPSRVTTICPKVKILVYRYGQIGDTIASIPALRAIRDHFRSAHVTLLSEVPSAGGSLPPDQVLPKGIVDEYLRYSGGASLRRIVEFAMFLRSLRRRHFDVLAYLAPSTRDAKRRRRDAMFFKLAGIERMIGMNGFPDDPFPRSPDGRLVDVLHETDALLARLAHDGVVTATTGAAATDLELTKDERAAADEWLAHNLPVANSARWFAICPGTKWPSKRWPLDRYVELAQRLCTEERLVPVVVGGPEDRDEGLRLVAACGVGACAAGQLTIRESAALLARALFYVGNDSGPMHLAATVGTPCVAVFSAQDWKGRWHPYGLHHEVLRAEVPCAGCFSPHCANKLECLTRISPADVYSACMRVLRPAHRSSRAASSVPAGS